MTAKVVPYPDSSLTYNNLAYLPLCLIHSLQTSQYIKINNKHVYKVGGHANIQDGTIALNSIQRDSIKVSVDDSCTFASWKPSNPASSITIEISPINRIKRIQLSETDLETHFKLFSDCIYVGKTFAMRVFGSEFKCTVTNILIQHQEDGENKQDESLMRSVTEGMWLPTTRVFWKPDTRHKNFDWKPAEKSAAHRLLDPNFKLSDMGVGGIDNQLGELLRRAFQSRLADPDTIRQLGIQHVRGIMLYGLPGTGKTRLARQIGELLTDVPPIVVNSPEILSKWQGAGESQLRQYFEPARIEYASSGINSKVHVIIFDEIDAIAKVRGMSGGGANTDTIVTQLLALIDGVHALPNVLVIGMTNRLDIIDPALTRPGRLEVKLEIGLPDESGRQQILEIHTREMRRNGYLSDDVSLSILAQQARNFSGAELEGLVKSAASFCLQESIQSSGEQRNTPSTATMTTVQVQMRHFQHAFQDIRPSFGVDDHKVHNCIRQGFVNFDPCIQVIVNDACQQFQNLVDSADDGAALSSLLIQGSGQGSGKSSLASHIALTTKCPFVRIISADQLLPMSDQQKQTHIIRIFEDAYKSKLSVVVLDDIDRMLECIGTRFNTQVWNTLNMVLTKLPPNPLHKLMIIGTTADIHALEVLKISNKFCVDDCQIPDATVRTVAEQVFGVVCDTSLSIQMPIRNALTALTVFKKKYPNIVCTASTFSQIARLYGFRPASSAQ